MTLVPGTPAAHPASVPVADPEPVLAAYPHVSRCPACRSYTAELLSEYPVPAVLAATLAHHDSGHSYDPMLAATEHFAVLE